jgi:hypothetical protein
LYISSVVKPKSKVRGRMALGNLSCEALLRPLPALITSSITRGSRPAFTPITIASEVIASAVADKRLLASFMLTETGLSPRQR